MSTQQQFSAALLDPERGTPAGLTTWNNSDPAKRFAVYRNNVIVSLVDALADTYPVTQELVGEDFFRAMARLFADDAPPRSPVLAFYGADFPDFIANFAPAASLPYLADVARLEMARVHAFHAADAMVLPTEDIAAALAEPDVLPELMLGLHPSLRLLRSDYAVVSLWAAHQGLADIASVDPTVPENALVLRPALEVEVMGVDAVAAEFMAQLLQGARLGDAAASAIALNPEFDLSGILTTLIGKHAITSITTTRRVAA